MEWYFIRSRHDVGLGDEGKEALNSLSHGLLLCHVLPAPLLLPGDPSGRPHLDWNNGQRPSRRLIPSNLIVGWPQNQQFDNRFIAGSAQLQPVPIHADQAWVGVDQECYSVGACSDAKSYLRPGFVCLCLCQPVRAGSDASLICAQGFLVCTTSTGFTVVSTSDGSQQKVRLPNGTKNIQMGAQKSTQFLLSKDRSLGVCGLRRDLYVWQMETGQLVSQMQARQCM